MARPNRECRDPAPAPARAGGSRAVRRLLALLAGGAPLVTGCVFFHVGPTSTAGAELVVDAPKPAPVDSTFEGCGPGGSAPDRALNRRKNRIDDASSYIAVPWATIAELPWPARTGYRFRNLWTRRERTAVARYEGAPVEVEGYLAGYRLEIPEPPNCYSNVPQRKDFHLWLSQHAHERNAESIVVELTPRVRVAHPGWTAERLSALQVRQVPVRVRGWLLLDQMHPERVERNRRTLWEVHPVMHLEWRDSTGAWVPLDSAAPAPPPAP